jgi:hypothetical protein
MNTDIHFSSGIRTHDPCVRAGEDGSCLTMCDHCDQHSLLTERLKKEWSVKNQITFLENIMLTDQTFLFQLAETAGICFATLIVYAQTYKSWKL